MEVDIEPMDQQTARPYQAQLEEIAAKQNTIIHLPTGSGKTFIAMSLIARFREALQKPWGEGGKRTFFLVNTIPLVDQQRRVIDYRCPVDGVGGYSGEDKVDFWKKDRWDQELSKNQVIVMTSQILTDMLTHSYIRISDINLLIFDECHHAVDDHPMRLVMKHFEDCPKHLQPRVLGLTATLLNANAGSCQKIEETLRVLETTFHATIATVNELGEVLEYSTNPYEQVLYFRPPTATAAATKAKGILNDVMMLVIDVQLPKVDGDPSIRLERHQQDITTDPKKLVKAVKNVIVAMISFIEEMGVYGGSLSIIAYTIVLERSRRKALSKEEATLYKMVITAATYARDILEESMKNDRGYDKIVKHSSEQVVQMLNILKEYNPAVLQKPGALLSVNMVRKPLSGIIFTKQRFTSKILYNILIEVTKENPTEFGFLKPDFIVGFNVNPFKNTREQFFLKKSSQTALLRFGNKELNLLISTSVIEEGVDIPQCLMVLRYDSPLEYRSYIQSKGRARSADASYVIMVNQDNRSKFMNLYRGFQDTEQYIHKMLVGNSDNRFAPTNEDITEGLYEDDDIPPYVTQYGGRLSAVQSISLLNRYCSVLPHDQFTTISPMWLCNTKVDAQLAKWRTITVLMPIACPVKEPVKGAPYTSLKSAKRSAALNACIKLHEAGELDPITLLPKLNATVNFDQEEIKQCFPNWPANEDSSPGEAGLPKPGSKARVRKHKKVFPACLEGPKDWKFGQQKFYLHLINLKAAFAKPKESREAALFEFIGQSDGYGFVTSKPLPALCDFPMFLKVGEVTTSLEVNYAEVLLTKDLFEVVKRFHLFVFEEVLDVAKKFLVFDGTVNCLYVVPTKMAAGRCSIDWDLMRSGHEVAPVSVPTYEERKAIRATRETYKHHVITPWYRSTLIPDRYIVSDVLEYMTPKSNFPNSYQSYEDYFESKYNLQIMGQKEQPMLEVININSRMNCILPRAATIKTLTDKQKKQISVAQGDDRPSNFVELFIPEYCVKYTYPGAMWYKATMLPSIVHRVTMLLIADGLRATIAAETGMGLDGGRQGAKWKPIETNIEISKKSLLSQIEPPQEINTIDRINYPIDTSIPRPVNVVSMKEAVFRLQQKKISQQYPWDEKSEPIDIERNLMSVTVMDIECYDKFVSAVISPKQTSTSVRSPEHLPAVARPAILAPPLSYNDDIDILTSKPSGSGPELRDVLAAITTCKSHDNFDLERCETLGDSFLKFAATLYLFHKFPTLSEGQITNIKGRLIGNRNLYYAGERINLGGRMKTEHFSPRKDFLVPGFFAPEQLRRLIEDAQIRPTFLIGLEFSRAEVLSGKPSAGSLAKLRTRLTDDSGEAEREPVGEAQPAMQAYVRLQATRDKCVADCVEALIGTYLLSGGIPGAVKVLEWLRVLPKKDNFQAYLQKSVPTAISLGHATGKEVDFLMNNSRSDVERIINYRFKDPSYLLEALSHPSYIRNRLTRSYERLELLGDAILDLLITSHVYERAHCLKPGDLTDLRSALVNNVTFAAYVVKLGLHKYLLSQLNPALDRAIISFVEHQVQRDHEIMEDVLYLIDEEDSHISEYVEVPKALSDIFESLAGAIYLDSGGDLRAVWRVVYRVMHRDIENFTRNIPKQPVRVLYEAIHACPVIGAPIVTKTEIPKVMVPVTVSREGQRITAHGFGNNKFQAKRAAAKIALKLLGV